MNQNEEDLDGRSKYDSISMQCFARFYWELDEDQQIEVRDLWNDKNE